MKIVIELTEEQINYIDTLKHFMKNPPTFQQIFEIGLELYLEEINSLVFKENQEIN